MFPGKDSSRYPPFRLQQAERIGAHDPHRPAKALQAEAVPQLCADLSQAESVAGDTLPHGRGCRPTASWHPGQEGFVN